MTHRLSASRTVTLGFLLAALGLAGAAPTLAHAAGKVSEKKRAAVLQAIVDCRPMTDTAARLECYDAAAAKLDQAEASGQVVVVDKEQVHQVRREIFGLQLPSLDVFSLGGGKGAAAIDKADDVENVVEKVKQAELLKSGKWSVEMESGAVWRQIDTNEITRDPHPGSKAEIRKASLGSFFMKIDGQPAVRAHRDR